MNIKKQFFSAYIKSGTQLLVRSVTESAGRYDKINLFTFYSEAMSINNNYERKREQREKEGRFIIGWVSALEGGSRKILLWGI